MGTKCFLLTRIPKVRKWLRRYSSRNCTQQESYHNGMFLLGDFDEPLPGPDDYEVERNPKPAADDPRWPATCDKDGFRFDDSDERQLFSLRLWADASGRLFTLREDTPPGAMWFAWWYRHDGKCGFHPNGDCDPRGHLIVRLPGGWDWDIDSRASNCTKPDDFTHRCWVRHGEPPSITVDKNGVTCGAGAGSILAGNYHGFLRNGELT